MNPINAHRSTHDQQVFEKKDAVKESLVELQKKIWTPPESSRTVCILSAERRFRIWRRNQQNSVKNPLCLLVRWLHEDDGIVLIRNYGEFTSLVRKLNEKAFKDFVYNHKCYSFLDDPIIVRLFFGSGFIKRAV